MEGATEVLVSLFLTELHGIVREGGGINASFHGQSYDVRRLDGATNTSIFTNTPVLPGYLALIARITKRDARVLQIGDVCTETGYGTVWHANLCRRREREPDSGSRV